MRHLTLFRPLALACMLALTAHGAWAEEPMLRVQVDNGDSLIALSKRLLSDPQSWAEVARLNKLANANRISPGQVLLVPQRLVRWQAVPAKIVSVSGEVTLAGEPALAGASIIEGQQLKTGSQSSAVMELSDGSRVQLPPSTLIEIVNSRRYASAKIPATGGATVSDDGLFAGMLRLLQGSVEVFATKVLRAKPLEVSTPTAVVGVRGTQFRVSVDPDPADKSTRTGVTEGVVQVDSRVAPVGAAVPAGFGTVLGQTVTAAPEVVKLLPGPDLSALPTFFDRPLVRMSLAGEARTLRVQVAADAAFNRIVGEQLVPAGTDIRLAGLEDGTWHWRARRLDARGLEGLDSTAQFTLKARPEPPATQTPAPQSKQIAGSVTFRWAQGLDATSYRLQLSQDPGFKTVLAEQTVSDDNLRLPLSQVGNYHWRVASVRANGDRGPFGDGQSFQLIGKPALPEGGVSPDGKQLQLHWNEGVPGSRYRVMLARDPRFQDIVSKTELDRPSWDLATPEQAGDYYFCYQTVEPDGFAAPHSDPLKVNVPRDFSKWWLMLLPLLASGL